MSISPAPSLCGMTLRIGDLAGRAGARFDVGGIDAGGRELDADLAGSGTRRIDFAELEHLAGGAVTLIERGAHFASLPVACRRWAG